MRLVGTERVCEMIVPFDLLVIEGDPDAVDTETEGPLFVEFPTLIEDVELTGIFVAGRDTIDLDCNMLLLLVVADSIEVVGRLITPREMGADV